MTTVLEKRYTPEDLLEIPDGERYELIEGDLVETEMGAEANWVASRINSRIDRVVDDGETGWTFGEGVGLQCFPDDPERVRRADGAFVRRGRFPDEAIPKGHIQIPPDWLLEVVSPTDLYYEVEQKVVGYLKAGVQLVWLVNPDSRMVRVFHQNGQRRDLGDNDELTGDDVIPGFRCRVAEVLPPSN